MTDLAFGAVIPAAGLSSRLEMFKPLIEIGPMTFVERTVKLFQTVGVKDIVVVAGYRGGEIITALEGKTVDIVTNPSYREGMFTSVQAGSGELQGRCDAFFVLPADIPLVRPMTLHRLMERFADRSALVCHPVFDSRRGHPPLIDASLINELLAWQGEGGLKVFLGKHADRSVDVPVADTWINRDVDTGEELEALRRDFERYTIPTRGECEVMLEHYLAVHQGIRAHGRKVAEVALRLGEALNTVGGDLDLDLLTAAGLLHDAFKGETDHAGQAAAWLRKAGFNEVSSIVAVHIDLPWVEGDAIDEKALVYLADKVVEGERVVTIAERRAGLLDRYGHDEEARRAIAARLGKAEGIQAAVEKTTGRALAKILGG